MLTLYSIDPILDLLCGSISYVPLLAAHIVERLNLFVRPVDSVDFVSISVALYGLIVFCAYSGAYNALWAASSLWLPDALVKERLAGKAPLLKFLSIKGIGKSFDLFQLV